MNDKAQIYNYEAMDSSGKSLKGSITALSHEHAVSLLKDRGFFPTRVRYDSGFSSTLSRVIGDDEPLPRDLVDLIAGHDDSVDVCPDDEPNDPLKTVATAIVDRPYFSHGLIIGMGIGVCIGMILMHFLRS
jgi:hypothetical protein